jgi:DNA polymerase III delta subunit
LVLEADLTDGFDARFIAVVSEDEVELLDLTHETVEKLRSKVSALETVDVVANEETLVPALSQLAQTPMFADGILVVLRFAKVSDAEAKVLIEAMENSLTSNYLLISSSKSLPKMLQGYLKDKGLIEVSKIGKRGSDYAESCFSRSSLVFSKDAKTVILEALGEDLSMLPSLLLTLESAISGETEVSRDDVQPFLHEIEDLAPWALPDLIVSGKTKEAYKDSPIWTEITEAAPFLFDVSEEDLKLAISMVAFYLIIITEAREGMPLVMFREYLMPYLQQ